jgi:hypothetical protein
MHPEKFSDHAELHNYTERHGLEYLWEGTQAFERRKRTLPPEIGTFLIWITLGTLLVAATILSMLVRQSLRRWHYPCGRVPSPARKDR